MAGLLSLGTRAMFASQAQLNTTAANISNANTAGYSRQTVQLETAGGQYSGAGFFGKGVNITTVSRAHNDHLSTEVATTGAVASADAARLDQLQRMENVFKLGENGLGFSAGKLLNSFTDVASAPRDASARQVVLSNTEELASRFRNTAGELTSLQAGVTQDLKTQVTAANELSKRIADLNQQIARVKGLGHAPNDLLDQREQLINELGQYVAVTQIPADDGTMGLFIGGGQRLVLGNSALELVAAPNAYDANQVTLGIKEAGVVRPVPENSLSGGSIAGLLRFQATDLAAAFNEIGRMAVVLSTRINEQQALGVNQLGATGGPLLEFGSARVLPNTNNTGSASPALTISDATQLQASDYELRFDGAAWQLTRLNDGSSWPYTPGTERDGLTLLPGAGAAAGDRFLLQPTRLASTDVRVATKDPRDIAAASPVIGEVASTNRGTVGVGSLLPKQADPALGSALTLTFMSPTTYSPDGGATTFAIVPGQPISLNGWELSLTGTPAAGDVINIRPVVPPATNNGNALAMLALREEKMVNGASITDAYASAIGDVGVRVQGAEAATKMSETIAKDALGARNNLSGVNLDEEAARLIQFQQSYQAAAKVLQIAQSVFDTLLQTAAG
ncbi:flagellar hook-associated protein FlgK [Caldimonas brevitalea]|uniref:Flagellar hook-associated protein 1 n=1 Tax=Caldimonas brevitalea TaxID=413882 RepID=A0A0G3BNJ0_9BURK|nr:flagellar hook-associated protein FlgK [Caldimonas brevitalea]AKJ30967.1 flagellar hook-associated protein 1 FlgK [Caldimonas brevitalea]